MKTFRKFIAAFVEGAIVGIALVILFNIFDVDVPQNHTTIMVMAIIFITSFASTIGRVVAKGEPPLRCEWVYHYGDHRIEVTAGLTEKLYINDTLADKTKGVSFKQATLKSKLDTGEDVVATIVGGTQVTCKLLVAGQELKPTTTKGDLAE